MNKISVGKYFVFCDSKPSHNHLSKNSEVVESLEHQDVYSEHVVVGVGENFLCPDLVIEGSYSPATGSGFNPALLIVPETDILFFGAGERIQIWDLKNLK